MGRFLNPDNELFREAVNSEIYVDKTELINFTNKVLNTSRKFICNSRPRRFGKSLTANMLTAYYSKGCDSHELFSRFNIHESRLFAQYINKFVVIQIDFQWFFKEEEIGNTLNFLTQTIVAEL